MMILKFFKKPYRWSGLYAFLLTGAFVFVLLDTFVIPRSYEAAAVVTSAETALASNSFGRNIKKKKTTSEIAKDQNAIFAINGDYYGFRDRGYVLRNGIAYRNTARASGDDELLEIDEKAISPSSGKVKSVWIVLWKMVPGRLSLSGLLWWKTASINAGRFLVLCPPCAAAAQGGTGALKCTPNVGHSLSDPSRLDSILYRAQSI